MAQRRPHGHAPPAGSDRALLFGPRPAYGHAVTGVHATAETELMETRNGRSVDTLRDRVGDMHELALNIGVEVDEQNKLLDGMGNTFDTATDRLGNTMRALQRLSASGGSSCHMCILFMFAFFFFFLVYLLLP
jgi:hypothetical protein